MADLSITAAKVAAAKVFEKVTGPAGEVITAGQPVRYDTTTGRFVKADATSAANGRVVGIALDPANAAGMPITVLTKGWLDLGDALGDLAYDADVFLSNTAGALADAAGTTSIVIGTVVPVWYGTTPDKLLRVNL